MTTTKHPTIYGQRGQVAWGELWEALGPAINAIFKGDTVYKNDGKPSCYLFLTCSHTVRRSLIFRPTWAGHVARRSIPLLVCCLVTADLPYSPSLRAWVPIHSDGGVFQAAVNTTFESTQGVLAERRMSMLQSLGSRTSGYQQQASTLRSESVCSCRTNYTRIHVRHAQHLGMEPQRVC